MQELRELSDWLRRQLIHFFRGIRVDPRERAERERLREETGIDLGPVPDRHPSGLDILWVRLLRRREMRRATGWRERNYRTKLVHHDELVYGNVEMNCVGAASTRQRPLGNDGWVGPIQERELPCHSRSYDVETWWVPPGDRRYCRARWAWRNGYAAGSSYVVLVPAERVTVAKSREAVRRFYMRAIRKTPRSLPPIEWDDEPWHVPKDERDRRRVLDQQERDDAELRRLGLSWLGRRRFRRFGRDPDDPLPTAPVRLTPDRPGIPGLDAPWEVTAREAQTERGKNHADG
jgi:hypothetical protein